MRLIWTMLLLGWASMAQAADLALIVGNDSYRRLPSVASAGDALGAADALRGAGFQVIALANADSGRLSQALSSLAAKAAAADRLIVVLNGQFVLSGWDTWLLPVDAPAQPALTDLSGALSLRTFYPLLAAHPGRAILATGWGTADGRAGDYLNWGVDAADLPQGVTLFQGDAASVSWFVTTAIARPGIRLADAAQRLNGISTDGYLPADYIFLRPATGPATDPTPVPLPDPDARTEAIFWDATRKADTLAGYQAYLRRYPAGPHASDAGRLIDEIRTEPDRAGRLAEDALDLSRDARTQIQKALQVLGHDPHGVDGIFGAGSRSAIVEWQTVNGVDSTGYLTGAQVALLSRQAQARAAQNAQEAAQQKAAQEAQDRAYWQATGAVGDEAGLRSYLDRYPDGVFAALAQQRLDAIDAANRQRVAAQDRASWTDARTQDTVKAYQDYLETYPQGLFANQAKSRIGTLEDNGAQAAQRQAAEAQEQLLLLSPATRLAVEKRLDAEGLNPGPVDGVFDQQTRDALQRYQAEGGLPATGYLNQITVVKLLADVFGR